MDWTLFWTAFGAIGGTIGAFATFAAVFVALWQTKYSYKKKLKLQFSDNVIITNNIGKVVAEFVSLTVTNIGNREIILTNWGFSLTKNSEVIVFSELSCNETPFPISEEIKTNFPYKLEIEQSKILYYEKTLFLKLIPEYFKPEVISPKKHLKCFVKDSTGKKYYVKSTKRINQYLNN
ncbi:MAG: hypothetical protein E7331_04380 [Clostridiales bacterium]|nr:hypothetical protein [Clostridiales bacterium]